MTKARTSPFRWAFVVTAGVLATALSMPGADAASKIGVASAVKNDVQAGAGRSLATGGSIFEQEVIRTGVESVAQLLFLDQTSLSVGPQSEVTLDRFVYDPSRGTGDVLLSATRGAFRFVSGAQNPLSYQINTPSATIGVRGTIVNCAVGSLTCVVDEGAAVIVVGGVEYRVEAGEALHIDDNGNVTGPYQHDGVFDVVKFGTPFPLFGGGLPTETWQTEIEDGATVRLEDLFEHDVICQEGSYGSCW